MANKYLKKTKKKNGQLNRRGIIGRIAVILVVIAAVFTGGLFFYTSYRLTGTASPTAELFDGKATVRFVDVGQGDCTLITWQGDSVLIDTGSAAGGKKAAEYVRMYAPSLDCMIITHPHEDHMGGAADIINSVKVGKLVMSEVAAEEEFYYRTIVACEKRGTEIVIVNETTEFAIGSISVDILEVFGYEYDDLNDASLITRVTVGETGILITGDAEAGEENYVLGKCGDDLDCDILKVGHHGSRSSTGEEFLQAVSPEICVISVGRGNSYGHPTDEVVNRIEEYGAELHRTDREGHVVLRLDEDSGRGLNIVWQKLFGD